MPTAVPADHSSCCPRTSCHPGIQSGIRQLGGRPRRRLGRPRRRLLGRPRRRARTVHLAGRSWPHSCCCFCSSTSSCFCSSTSTSTSTSSASGAASRRCETHRPAYEGAYEGDWERSIVMSSSPCVVVTAALVAIGDCPTAATTHDAKIVAAMLEHILKACLGTLTSNEDSG